MILVVPIGSNDVELRAAAFRSLMNRYFFLNIGAPEMKIIASTYIIFFEIIGVWSQGVRSISPNSVSELRGSFGKW